jgi:hypothetical protein
MPAQFATSAGPQGCALSQLPLPGDLAKKNGGAEAPPPNLDA